MNSTAKALSFVAVVVALIFGVTFISQFNVAPSKKIDGNTADAPGSTESNDPLLFGTGAYKYDPASEYDTDRLFSGFFEVGTDKNYVLFPFRNKRPQEVRLSPLPPSCGKCTAARAALIPAASMNTYLATVAAGSLVASPVDLVSALAWAEVYAKLEWFPFDFNDPNRRFVVPAAAAKSEVWGLIELEFKIGEGSPPRDVLASFFLHDAAGNKLLPLPLQLKVNFAGRDGFELSKYEFDVGELPEGTDTRSFDIYAISMTRPFSRFAPPAVLVTGMDPLVSVGTPVPMTPADNERFIQRMLAETKSPVRVLSGYRIPVTVHRQAAGTPPDVGKFEKELSVGNVAIGKSYRVAIKGVVVGQIRLDGGTKIELGSYKSDYSFRKSARISTNAVDLDLEIVEDQCRPTFVKYGLGPPTVEFGQKSWPVQIGIAEKEGRSPPWEGRVVLRSKGPNPTTFRIPVTGHGQ